MLPGGALEIKDIMITNKTQRLELKGRGDQGGSQSVT